MVRLHSAASKTPACRGFSLFARALEARPAWDGASDPLSFCHLRHDGCPRFTPMQRDSGGDHVEDLGPRHVLEPTEGSR
jgi:hypothetical protein